MKNAIIILAFSTLCLFACLARTPPPEAMPLASATITLKNQAEEHPGIAGIVAEVLKDGIITRAEFQGVQVALQGVARVKD